jgi:hypothetical protein
MFQPRNLIDIISRAVDGEKILRGTLSRTTVDIEGGKDEKDQQTKLLA